MSPSKTILVVDDSTTIVMSVKTTLEIAGYRVETADDGTTALARLDAGLKPDLIITDMNMPVMGGMDLIKGVKAQARFRFTPILTLTTESQLSLRDEAKQLGATGWMVKPIGANDLLKIIKQVLPGA